jgi:hypothetical protein
MGRRRLPSRRSYTSRTHPLAKPFAALGIDLASTATSKVLLFPEFPKCDGNLARWLRF